VETLTSGDIMQRPLIMGILNLTPDSFSDGGRFNELTPAVEHARAMQREGADWIDIGGESTRPGAEHVPVDMELNRVVPVVREVIAADASMRISVDTSKAIVAREAIHVGASMINDVTAGTHDPAMFTVAAEANVPMVLMHMNGEPRTMQNAPHYTDVVAEVRAYLEERVAAARAAGVRTVYVDPGIGFGKTLEHNLALLRSVATFAPLADGVVLGISRKRFLGAITGIEDPIQRDVPTAFVHALLWHAPVHMIRVHDVALHAQLRTLATALGD
jgi:dihydropteroate synthase